MPVHLTKETAGKDMIYQKSYGAYLIKIKKAEEGQEFTGLDPEDQEALLIPLEGEEDAPAPDQAADQATD